MSRRQFRGLPALSLTLLLALPVLLASAAAAKKPKPPPSINNLKGTYNGSASGDLAGSFKLKVTKDNSAPNTTTRLLKATMTVGGKGYSVQGSFLPDTRQANLAGVSGKPPNVTQASFVGFFDPSGISVDGGYQILKPGSLQAGEAQGSR